MTGPPPSLDLAGPRLDKSGASVSGRVKSGNPWRDPRSGTFSNGPPGMRVAAGGDLLKDLSNQAKQYLSNLQKSAKGSAISAVMKNGKVVVSILNSAGQPVSSVSLAPGKGSAPKSGATAATTLIAQMRRRDLVADLARYRGELDVAQVRKLFKDRVSGVEDSDIQKVLADAERQRMSDVVDVLSQKFSGAQGDPLISIGGSDKDTQQTLNGFSDEQRRLIVARLAARGVGQRQAESFVLKGTKTEEAVKTTVDKEK